MAISPEISICFGLNFYQPQNTTQNYRQNSFLQKFHIHNGGTGLDSMVLICKIANILVLILAVAGLFYWVIFHFSETLTSVLLKCGRICMDISKNFQKLALKVCILFIIFLSNTLATARKMAISPIILVRSSQKFAYSWKSISISHFKCFQVKSRYIMAALAVT